MKQPAHTPRDTNLAARLICGAMIILGFVGLYTGWHFTAAWSPTHDGNMLGTGWILEPLFWTLRAIPGWLLCGAAVVFGALGLHGMALPPKVDRQRAV